jgi:hypothetical protein
MEYLFGWLDVPYCAAKWRISDRAEEAKAREFPALGLLFRHWVILNRGAD